MCPNLLHRTLHRICTHLFHQMDGSLFPLQIDAAYTVSAPVSLTYSQLLD